MSTNSTADLLVIGGGPAGSAAAIWAAMSGLRVKLLERSLFPRHRPGETLHPGLEPIFKQLGVEERVSAVSALRPDAVAVEWGGRRARELFGADEGGAWRGYQVSREDLDTILLERARQVGVEVVQPVTAGAPLVNNGRVVGVRTGSQKIGAGFVIDATGGAGWLRRHLHLLLKLASPPLWAYYGYCEGDIATLATAPSLVGDGEGWTWTSQVAPHRLHWTRLSFGGRPSKQPPKCFSAFRQLGDIRGAHVTWRTVPASAGLGYFLVGDAASVLDPASSHGVLRALMSSMMASHVVKRILRDGVKEDAAYAGYRGWIGEWFERDVRRLRDYYRQLDYSWESRHVGRPQQPLT